MQPDKCLSVLVTDDVDEITEMIATWLRAGGHTVRTASSGHDAIKHMRHQACDLVIADVLLPDMDGVDLIRQAKALDPQPRFLAISGGGDFLSASYCLTIASRLGAHATLMKPFTAEQLGAAIETALM